jgi:DNA uptake protein ComE-like DNA-binding protein
MDQAAVAVLVTLSLVGMGVYWVVQGGPRGELIEIDRAEPLTARYLVDINKAEWSEFAELPDIGETLAQRIVDSRKPVRFAIMTICGECAGLGHGRWRR